jgi:hypothetical protein
MRFRISSPLLPVLLLLTLTASRATAQGGPPPTGRPPAGAPGGGPPGRPVVTAPDSTTLQSQAIRVFLDCQGRVRGCDRDFIVTDVNFVNWMRDRFDADVQILVSGLTNGGGGTENTITFIGRRKLRGDGRYPGAQHAAERPGRPYPPRTARTFKLGLARYVARSPIATRVQMAYVAPFGQQQQQASAANLKDKWNLWTYTSNFNAFIRAEDQQQSINGSLSLSANRATEKWKLNFSVSGNVNEQRFEIPATATRERVHRDQRTAHVQRELADRALAVVALVGGAEGRRRLLRLPQSGPGAARAAGRGVQLFPWTEQTRRQLTFLYNVGPNYYDYQRTTVFDRERRRASASS